MPQYRKKKEVGERARSDDCDRKESDAINAGVGGLLGGGGEGPTE